MGAFQELALAGQLERHTSGSMLLVDRLNQALGRWFQCRGWKIPPWAGGDLTQSHATSSMLCRLEP